MTQRDNCGNNNGSFGESGRVIFYLILRNNCSYRIDKDGDMGVKYSKPVTHCRKMIYPELTPNSMGKPSLYDAILTIPVSTSREYNR